MQLTNNFHLDEFTSSQTASRLGLRNRPGANQVENLRKVAATLEQVRKLLGKPITISSGYRSPAVNAAVGGSKTSDHQHGFAVDFICPGYGKPIDICRAIVAAGIAFDQLIEEGTWVHLSVSPRMRGEVLTMRGGKYFKGLR